MTLALPAPAETTTIEKLQREIRGLEADLRDAKTALELKAQETEQILKAHERLKKALSPIYNSLRQLFGDLDHVGAEDARDFSYQPSLPAWEPVKQRYKGKIAEMIDILLKYPNGLTGKQFASLSGYADTGGTFSQNIYKMRSGGFLEKNGNIYRLKDL